MYTLKLILILYVFCKHVGLLLRGKCAYIMVVCVRRGHSEGSAMYCYVEIYGAEDYHLIIALSKEHIDQYFAAVNQEDHSQERNLKSCLKDHIKKIRKLLREQIAPFSNA